MEGNALKLFDVLTLINLHYISVTKELISTDSPGNYCSLYKDMWLQRQFTKDTTQLQPTVYPACYAPLCLAALMSSWCYNETKVLLISSAG